MPNPEPLTLEILQQAVTKAAAFRCRRRLQPAGGPGDKVFPPTYAGAVYAVEQRRLPGRAEPVTCVLLDSVQSQANRMELALQEAVDAGLIQLPLVVVDFTPWSPDGNKPENERLLKDVGRITSLQLPHRIADAVLRRSQTQDGTEFRKSPKGSRIDAATPQNATPLFELCPTALIFGMWDSTGPKGGLGAKFERAMVSEIVGVGASFGIKTASRINPLITKTEGIVLYRTPDGNWTLDPQLAMKKKDELVKVGKNGKASEANLGNVTPAFAKYTKGAEGLDPLRLQPFSADYRISVGQESLEIRHHAATSESEAREGRIAAGGATIEYAEQITTLSLIVLRRLRFPINGQTKLEVEIAARTVLAALGLCAATLAFEKGAGLRSRCLLWPEEPMIWELLAKPGEEPQRFLLPSESAVELLKEAVKQGKGNGIAWEETPILLWPDRDLLGLVRLSQKKELTSWLEGETTKG